MPPISSTTPRPTYRPICRIPTPTTAAKPIADVRSTVTNAGRLSDGVGFAMTGLQANHRAFPVLGPPGAKYHFDQFGRGLDTAARRVSAISTGIAVAQIATADDKVAATTDAVLSAGGALACATAGAEAGVLCGPYTPICSPALATVGGFACSEAGLAISEQVKPWVRTTWDGFTDRVSSGWESITSSASSAWSRITSWF